jgi:hypothetical protein
MSIGVMKEIETMKEAIRRAQKEKRARKAIGV